MDEPFVSLDESTAHDSREAVQLAQRIIVLCAPPATIVRDRSVDLTVAQRADPLQLEALREKLLLEDGRAQSEQTG